VTLRQTDVPAAPVLDAPVHGAIDVAVRPLFSWQAAAEPPATGFESFQGQDAPERRPGLRRPYGHGLLLPASQALQPQTQYSWTLTSQNGCGSAPSNDCFDFTTGTQSAPSTYTLIVISPTTTGAAHAVNGNGQVAGTLSSGAFRWQNGSVTVFPGFNTWATGIDENGLMVGFSPPSSSTPPHAVIFTTPLTFLGVPGGGPTGYSRAWDINNNGLIVGEGGPTQLAFPTALRWDNGVMTDLPTLGGTSGTAYGVNDNGDIVGSSRLASGHLHAFLLPSGGSIVDLGTLGGDASEARGINEAGVVVGWANDSVNARFAFRYESGTLTNLGALSGHVISEARGINAQGIAVGYSTGGGTNQRAVRWVGGLPAEDLNTLINPPSSTVVVVASAIGADGSIAGWTAAPSRAVVLVPNP
jgi:probable HAF family extracellular repeat protein